MMNTMIEISGLRKAYGDHMIFNDFNLCINRNEFVAITGRSGKGKSTLLNMIGLLEKKDKGTIVINGIINASLHQKSGRQLLKTTIGYLFQNYALIDNESVLYNLNIALRFQKLKKAEKMERVIHALSEVGLTKADLTKKVYKLSGGEQQRVALARIMLKPCEIILADEPTGSLDEKNRDNVLSILKALQSKGKTILVVTHDTYVANYCDRIIQL